jgi:hypothetical protein
LASQNSDKELINIALDIQSKLQDWQEDSEYWTALTSFLVNYSAGPPPSRVAQDALDDEVEFVMLSRALRDEPTATAVMLEVPPRIDFTTPRSSGNAQSAVAQINRNVLTRALNDPQTSRRRWRIARALRRVHKGVAGGILIGADVVVPDPTLIARVASVLGGIDLIMDAAR